MNLTDKTEEELFILWGNCRNALENSGSTKRHEKANELIAHIKSEWNRRIADAEQGDYPVTRPQKGMMSRLGYHVGEVEGLLPGARRKIIDLVMVEQLPFFHSPMYVKEWGEPKSSERYQKLESFFEGMLNGYYSGDMDRAKDEWSKDLEYLRERYKDEY